MWFNIVKTIEYLTLKNLDNKILSINLENEDEKTLAEIITKHSEYYYLYNYNYDSFKPFIYDHNYSETKTLVKLSEIMNKLTK